MFAPLPVTRERCCRFDGAPVGQSHRLLGRQKGRRRTRPQPFEKRKEVLARLLRRAPAGLQLCEYLDGDGAGILEHAGRLGSSPAFCLGLAPMWPFSACQVSASGLAPRDQGNPCPGHPSQVLPAGAFFAPATARRSIARLLSSPSSI